MSLKERNAYLSVMQEKYQQAESRQEKGCLLDEMVRATNMNRDYLSHKLQQPIRRKKRQRERGKTYGSDVDEILRKVAQAQQHICAARLGGYLLETAENLAQHGQLYLDDRLRAQLAEISVSTLRRHLEPLSRPRQRSRSAGSTTSLQRQIPIRRIPWNESEPGHCEVDLVHHGGSDPKGHFGYTLQVIDVATGWSGRRAILGRGSVVVADALFTIFQQFPFPVVELHMDNGSEFLNHQLITFLQHFYPTLKPLRSPPFNPNHNRFVEQKNRTLVRQYIDNQRLDTVVQIRYLNTIYQLLGRCYNLWQPVFHQIAKQRLPATAERSAYTKRIHDLPKPPLERLIATKTLSEDTLHTLRSQQHSLDLFASQERALRMFKHLFAYPCALPGVTENVYETLAYPELFPAAFVALGVVSLDDLKSFYSIHSPVLT